MYGMVNEGIHTFIQANYGDGTWQSICDKAGLDRREFERMASYDDAITYSLVGAIVDQTGISQDEVLQIFGGYWIEFVNQSNFGKLMRMSGDSFVDRVNGLDDMHDRILLAMPHLKPPSFELEGVGDKTYHLHYYSDREGLSPMVIGLLYGLASDTGEKIRVTHLPATPETSDHEVFEIVMLD
ncbi:heme NO-binding domain-containing protein [uncultured Roseovarius sp.]|uniref:heme NO-binding domain-containing protein n=1 Tax=uncultured Roseovarius sp. TaxID=293344 RepID=UPI00260F2DFD|nr:heme NO-binding domain-containing protein [uncultured Roseovarius sp.]